MMQHYCACTYVVSQLQGTQQTVGYHVKNTAEVSQRTGKEMEVREAFSPFFYSWWLPQANITKMVI